MSANHEKIAHLAVLTLFGRKDPRAMLPYVHPYIQRYSPSSAYAEHGAPAFFARLAERRADRPAGRLVLETIAATQDLVAIGWEYLTENSPYLTNRQATAAGRREGTFLIRIDPASARITHIWQMGDEVEPAVAALTPRTLLPTTSRQRRKSATSGREALRMALGGEPRREGPVAALRFAFAHASVSDDSA